MLSRPQSDLEGTSKAALGLKPPQCKGYGYKEVLAEQAACGCRGGILVGALYSQGPHVFLNWQRPGKPIRKKRKDRLP